MFLGWGFTLQEQNSTVGLANVFVSDCHCFVEAVAAVDHTDMSWKMPGFSCTWLYICMLKEKYSCFHYSQDYYLVKTLSMRGWSVGRITAEAKILFSWLDDFWSEPSPLMSWGHKSTHYCKPKFWPTCAVMWGVPQLILRVNFLIFKVFLLII